jgi:hypothetical protein
MAERDCRANRELQREKFDVLKYADDIMDMPTSFLGWMNVYRRSWFRGFATRIAERLIATADAAKAETKKQKGNDCLALVHIEKDELAVKDFVDKSTTKGEAFSMSAKFNHDGYKQGQATGSNVALTSKTFKHGPRVETAGLLGRG